MGCWRQGWFFSKSRNCLLADHIHGIPGEGRHAVDDVQRCDGFTVIKRQHAAFKIPAESRLARPDVDGTTTTTVEIDVGRTERLLNSR